MKSAVILLVVLVFAGLALGQDRPTITAQPNTVFVGADGKFEANPDTALVQFNISAQQDNSRAAYDQAFAQYRATVLSAFQNVADTLYAIQSDADALRATVASRDAAEKSLNSARLRLRVGDANVLVVLNAEQTYQQAVISLAQARAARFADTVALFQALGGGWWTDLRPGLTDQSPRVIRTGIVRSSGP